MDTKKSNCSMSLFSVSQQCKVDAKGRLMFPAAYRKALGDAFAEGFVLKHSIYTKSLELHTKANWEKELLKLKKLNRYKEKHQQVIRHLLYGIRNVEPDAAGRLLLPKDLLKHAEIRDEVTFSPFFTYLEIWSTNNYKQNINESAPKLPDMVEEVMGDIGTDED